MLCFQFYIAEWFTCFGGFCLKDVHILLVEYNWLIVLLISTDISWTAMNKCVPIIRIYSINKYLHNYRAGSGLIIWIYTKNCWNMLIAVSFYICNPNQETISSFLDQIPVSYISTFFKLFEAGENYAKENTLQTLRFPGKLLFTLKLPHYE